MKAVLRLLRCRCTARGIVATISSQLTNSCQEYHIPNMIKTVTSFHGSTFIGQDVQLSLSEKNRSEVVPRVFCVQVCSYCEEEEEKTLRVSSLMAYTIIILSSMRVAFW